MTRFANQLGARVQRCFVAAVTVVLLPFACGCHNRDAYVSKQMTWQCPALNAGYVLPKKLNNEGMVNEFYKKSTAAWFSFVEDPGTIFGLYQPGLCEALAANGAPVVNVRFGVTYTPRNVLIGFEPQAIDSWSLASAETVRTGLYLKQDEKRYLARKKGESLAAQADPHEMILHYAPADKLLR